MVTLFDKPIALQLTANQILLWEGGGGGGGAAGPAPLPPGSVHVEGYQTTLFAQVHSSTTVGLSSVGGYDLPLQSWPGWCIMFKALSLNPTRV